MNRKEIFNKLWRAADIMRRDDGTNGINEYIEQISWMFFLKVFDDIEKRFEYNAKLKDEKYQRIIPKKIRWSEWIEMDTKKIIDYIDSELFPMLGKLSGTPERSTIGLIFSEIRRNKMKSPSNLKDVIDIIKGIDFNNEDDSHALSIFYEELLVKLGKESGIAGEFYTPRPIVKLIVKMVNPQLNSKNKKSTRMLDPFCGSCGFLIESFKNILETGKVKTKDVPLLQRSFFHGYEKKSLPYLVGLMNCILHELITPNVERRNSLNNNIMTFTSEEKFDYVLTNPPFGGVENKQIQQNFPIKHSATELLALQQVMRRLKINGKCGIVVPDGLLSQGLGYGKVKKELLENYNVHTIISLPPGVFANVTASGQGPKTSLIFFDKSGKTKKIWYYELEPKGGKRYSKANPISEVDLVDCYEKWKKKSVSSNSWIYTIDDIVEKEFDLSAQNPNKEKQIVYEDPNEVLDNIIKSSKKFQTDINELKKILTKITYKTEL